MKYWRGEKRLILKVRDGMTKIKKYILEIRYKALAQAFDRRGKILTDIHGPFEQKLAHWSVENVGVTMQTDVNSKKKLIHISHLRSFIAYESPDSEAEFVNDSLKLFKNFYKCFPELKIITRVGYRLVDFMGGENSLGYYYKLIRDVSLKQPIIGNLPVNDANVTLEYPNGRVSIGSVKPEDKFIERNFPDYWLSHPEEVNGRLIDVDTYIKDIEIKRDSDIIGALKACMEAGKEVFENISNSVGS